MRRIVSPYPAVHHCLDRSGLDAANGGQADLSQHASSLELQAHGLPRTPGHGVTPSAGLSNLTPFRRAWSIISAT